MFDAARRLRLIEIRNAMPATEVVAALRAAGFEVSIPEGAGAGVRLPAGARVRKLG
jgi:hypothetical protein